MATVEQAQYAALVLAHFKARMLDNKLEIVNKHIIRGTRGGLYYVNNASKKVYLKAYQKRQCVTPGLAVKGAGTGGAACTN